jgi:hypothetical protein
MGKGQAWSIDLILGVLIFLISLGIIYSLLLGRNQENPATLRIESEVIATKLVTDPSVQVASDNALDVSKVVALTSQQYDALKQQLGAKHDFCIYLQDDQGNLVYIVDPATGDKYPGVGSKTGDFNLSGWPCGKKCDPSSQQCAP